MVFDLFKNIFGTLLVPVLVAVMGTSISAADCSTDPNSCTPKQLCEISTKNVGDVKVWADSNDLRSHVEVAKELGINCGNVKDECDVSPEKCKLNQICERATAVENGKLNWNFDNLDHVVLAKEYGLKCLNDDVEAVTQKPENQNLNQSSSEAIDVVKLIQIEMNRIGCSLGNADGAVGPASKRALAKFNKAQGTSFAYDIFFQQSFLETLKKIDQKVCISQQQAGESSGSSTQKEGKSANKKLICEMEHSEDFNAIEKREKYILTTKNAFKNLHKLQLNNGKLKFGVYDVKPYETDKWKLFFKVRCRDNKNDWSPCGEFSASVNVQKINENQLKATLHTPWIWNRGVPPQADMIYTCK